MPQIHFSTEATSVLTQGKIGEMDKVVQGNTANAEESAAASEELNAQAEQLKPYVVDLVGLITGKKDEKCLDHSIESLDRSISVQKSIPQKGTEKILTEEGEISRKKTTLISEHPSVDIRHTKC